MLRRSGAGASNGSRLGRAPVALAMLVASPFLCSTASFGLTTATLAQSDDGSAGLFEEVELSAASSLVYAGDSDDALLLPEITGPGVALVDVDKDGDLDILTPADPETPPTQPIAAVLFENQSTSEGNLGFATPRSIAAGEEGLGMGVAVGDVDRDGWDDVYVTRLGPNVLLGNRSGELAVRGDAGPIAGNEWSVSAALVDLDGDGWLDLYVVNYLVWSPDGAVTCYADSSRRDYCGPAAYPPAADRLYRNRGDGTFEPWHEAVLAANPGPGLGVLPTDVNADDQLDLLVANDGARNHLWVHDSGQLSDQALLLGMAVNARGLPEASMGIAAGDIDADGDEDVYITHLTGETGTLYRFDDGLLYTDVTTQAQLGPVTFDATGFGTAFVDFENDGDPDLLIANGAVRLPAAGAGDGHPLGQENQAFENDDGRFAAVSAMPASFVAREASRGLAAGDLDNDGAVDFVVANNGGPLRVYRNLAGREAWRLAVELGGASSEGARVTLGDTDSSTSRLAVAVSRRNSSYASANDARIVFGLGRGQPPKELVLDVRWPGGETSRHAVAPAALSRPGSPGSYFRIDPP